MINILLISSTILLDLLVIIDCVDFDNIGKFFFFIQAIGIKRKTVVAVQNRCLIFFFFLIITADTKIEDTDELQEIREMIFSSNNEKNIKKLEDVMKFWQNMMLENSVLYRKNRDIVKNFGNLLFNTEIFRTKDGDSHTFSDVDVSDFFYPEKFDELFKYFEKTPRELIAMYLENPDNLNKDMKERLVHEADIRIMRMLESSLDLSDPLLAKISEKFSKSNKDGFRILF
ncbi:MAG: hypothetical protein ACTSWX_16240 [Promethearchaeota archaeon]